MKEYQNINLSQSVYKKFFHDETKKEVEEVLEKALELYFNQKM